MAVLPTTLVLLCGWLTMAGGTSTVNVATWLVTLPAALVTTTVYEPA